MSIDTERARQWLDAYSHAWLTYDPDEIGALFADDAEYRWHPWDDGDEVARGRAQIVAGWLESRDRAGTYRGEYRPLLIQGDQVIAVGVSSYYTDETQTTLDRVFHNLWVLRFNDAGQCQSFTEWYMEAPKAS
ncbi:MAG TPA: nuclear transport factor 2 family protein [Ktedonobacterales bacterium]|jgi:ketosteroid isomerase-like protein|nr:nuclear transport factor 2 family protein [Ktedonobacterales bacterium]